MKRSWKKIEDGVWCVTGGGRDDAARGGAAGVLYFRGTFGGSRICSRAETQGDMAWSGRRLSAAIKLEYARWVAELDAAAAGAGKTLSVAATGAGKTLSVAATGAGKTLSVAAAGDGRRPTFAKLAEMYERYSQDERIKNGKPSEGTVRNVLNAFRVFVEEGGYGWNASVALVTTDRIDEFLVDQIKSGKARVSAWTYAASWQSVTARWTANYYRREGYEVQQVTMPTFAGRRAERYVRPPKEALEAIKDWYERLWDRTDKRMWMCVTMMLNFAMRNGDVCRMEEDWFRGTEDGTGVELLYTPHKTRLTSGRRCRALVHPDLWRKIKEAIRTMPAKWQRVDAAAKPEADGRPECVAGPKEVEAYGLIPAAKWALHQVNAELRALVPWFAETGKAAYELRKICVDHIYQQYGAEKASAISGDDVKTLSYYYAEPERATNEAVMVADLI